MKLLLVVDEKIVDCATSGLMTVAFSKQSMDKNSARLPSIVMLLTRKGHNLAAIHCKKPLIPLKPGSHHNAGDPQQPEAGGGGRKKKQKDP